MGHGKRRKAMKKARQEVVKELERRHWGHDGLGWKYYPFVLIRKPRRVGQRIATLWHLERIDKHPGHAWFTDATVPYLFTIVDAEMEAWK